MAVTTSEIVWFTLVMVHIGHSTLLHCYNRSVIQIARNYVFHEHTKHIEINCHYNRHHLRARTVPFVMCALDIANVFANDHVFVF